MNNMGNPRELYDRMEKETVPCGICRSNSFVKILDRDRYQMGLETVLCKNCGFIFTNPRPTQDEMNRFYRHVYRRFYTGTTDPSVEYGEKLHMIKRKWLYDILEEELEKRKIQNPTVLDAGCGAGAILSLFHQHWPSSKLYGIEPFDKFGEYAATRSGAQVFIEDIDQFIEQKRLPTGELDALIMNHSFEHLYNPLDKLISMRQFLKPGALTLIQVPNLFSPHWEKTLPIFHIAHTSHFAPLTLDYLLRLAGFKILKAIPISEPVHLKAMTFLAQMEEAVPTPTSVKSPSGDALKILFKQVGEVRDKANAHLLPRGPITRLICCVKDRGIEYTVRRFAFHIGRSFRKLFQLFSFSKLHRYDSIGGYLNNFKNDPIMRKVLANERVLILGSGPSAQDLEALPNDFKILTCNASLRILAEKNHPKPVDIFLCRKKAMIQDYKDVETLLKRVKTNLFMMDDPSFILNKPTLNGSYSRLLKDHQKDNFYLEKLIQPKRIGDLSREEVNWTSAGVRLLQYALYYGAKEIYLLGIDLSQDKYFWGETFVNKHPMDFAILEIFTKKYKNIYVASPNSACRKYFPFKAMQEDSVTPVQS